MYEGDTSRFSIARSLKITSEMSVQDGLVQYFEDAANKCIYIYVVHYNFKLDCMLWRNKTEQVTSLG